MPEATRVKTELERGADLSIIDLVDSLIAHAHSLGASDMHLDPTPAGVRIRFRVDGILADKHLCPNTIQPEIISRIKVLAGLRTDEHQAAQDGRFRINLSDREPIDVRVSVIPTYHGENAVMRLLASAASDFTLAALGFSQSDEAKILHALQKPSGMILATGPTGSGKTTTLYTLIKQLHQPTISIVTVEDPIEYAIEGIKQIQVNPRSGLTFANGLRSILRQDPNVIMVGEIRDSETAGIATNVALTGHLLLSTLHTSDAATTLPRLLDLKVEPFLVASTVNLAIAQRLVRKVCRHCKKGGGCEHCHHTGYYGRISINEVMLIDNDLREAILQKTSASELRRLAIKNGMTTMREDGQHKVAQGLTTMEEILRVSHD